MKLARLTITMLAFICAACGKIAIPALPATPSLLPAQTNLPPSPTATAVTPTMEPCAGFFEKRPVQINTRKGEDGKPLYTLTTNELKNYLDMMGIESICLPQNTGVPYLIADWDSAKLPATGRMVSIGFDKKYPGMGWGGLFLLYSTYDFKFGTEFERYAKLADRDALRAGILANMVEINGVKGFTRVKPLSMCMGDCAIEKAYIFMFEDHYVALVATLDMVGYDKDINTALGRVEAGEIGAEYRPAAEMLETLVERLRFNLTQQ
jgi:hypothetical protein